MNHEKFHYKTLEDVKQKCEELGVWLPFEDETKMLAAPLSLGARVIPNRLGIAPMEGSDAAPDGGPSEYTERRYCREAEGGAGIIWYEAVSIAREGRSSSAQLFIDADNVDSFKRLNEKVKETGLKANGFEPYLIMQANHSGRYSNPDNKPSPLIAERNSWLETFRAADDSCIVSDDYLKHVEEAVGDAALLARKAGFDAVDIKSCHGYLFQEVIAAYDRKGEYGGSYENRTRLLKNSIRAAKAHESSNFRIVSRVGVYDGYPAESRGFGQREDGSMDLSEPKKLIRELYDDLSIAFINITMGNPYATTHIARPFDNGMYIPDEHPLEGLARMINGTGEIKKACPEMIIYGSAPTYLRQFSDLYAAGAVSLGLCDGFLFGRMAFSNPYFPNEILKNGRIDPSKTCLACGKCGDLIRSHKPTGCVIRDSKIFLPFYKEFMAERKNLPKNFRG